MGGMEVPWPEMWMMSPTRTAWLYLQEDLSDISLAVGRVAVEPFLLVLLEVPLPNTLVAVVLQVCHLGLQMDDKGTCRQCQVLTE